MAQLIIPGVYLVSINARSGGQQVTNVVGIDKGFSTAEEVANRVLLAWTQPVGPCVAMPTSYQMESVTATDLTFPDGDVASVPDTMSGQALGGLATNAASALAVYGGGTRSRSSKGRMYFGPLRESQIDPDGRTITGASREVIRQSLVNFQDVLAQEGFLWCVVSRKLATRSIINPAGIGVQPIIATQRRRIRS